MKLQMEAYFFNHGDPIHIIAFFASFKLACDNKRIHKRVAMRFRIFFVKNAIDTTLDSCMSATTHIAAVAASVNTVEPTEQEKLFRSYPEVVNY